MSGVADAGGYPGNPSLPREVREKILSTFRHTLNLFREGKMDDCLIGCDFILKMDPRFTPARQLLEKTKNPAADVDLAELEGLVAETPTRQERVASVESDRLLVRAAESYNAREFDAAIAAAEQVLQVLPGNQDATEILAKARMKKNAQPQFEVARQRALAALDAHRPSEASAALEKMRSLDAKHPAVALLERRLAPAPPASALEIGESTNPGFAMPVAERVPHEPPEEPNPAGSGLDDLSLDSLSLDEPREGSAFVPPPMDPGETTGPLSLSGGHFDTDSGAPPNLWSEEPEGIGNMALDSRPEPPPPAASAYGAPPPFPAGAPEPPSQEQEIESLLTRGDDAVRSGNRQQAIEIWSRIFLIDINNSEAVGRIEKARQEMAEGNRRIADGLKRGRESFEAGDLSAAREMFLQVLAVDETDGTARSYLDRIEQELARPSARPSSGLDLSKKTPQGDILEEEMASASEPDIAAVRAESREKAAATPKAPRRPMDRRFLMALGAAVVLTIAVSVFFLMRSSHGKPGTAAASDGGPSLEHATSLFREGKLTETVAELRKISAENPDYARAQKLLASLTRTTETGGEPAAGESEAGLPGKPAAAAGGPPAEAVRFRAEAEKALAEKRYIDALKNFNMAAPTFSGDPTFAQSLGVAAERVNELTPAVKLYNEAEYETAIPILWRLYQGDRANQDARSYLLRAYFNQGVGQLQNGLFPKAAESFKEVLGVDAGDAEAARHKKFAERYLKGGELDMMGRIYVRHLLQRP